MFVVKGDCLDEMRKMQDGGVDLIMTSPPYAEQRKKTYDGVPVEQYTDWFLERSEHFKRILVDEGSFILNIKHHTKDGQKSLYVYKLLLALCEQQGWILIDDMIWSKKNGFPSSRKNGLRDSWEFCFHLAKQTDIKIRKENIMVPAKPSTIRRIERLCENDLNRTKSGTGSGMDTRMVKFTNAQKGVYPPNVLYMSAETTNQGHSAVFPVRLPDFFIRLLTDPGDRVFDPFAGSGTTGVAAYRLGRWFLGVEKEEKYWELAVKRLKWESKQRRLEL